jgi:hypothetical protein
LPQIVLRPLNLNLLLFAQRLAERNHSTMGALGGWVAPLLQSQYYFLS